MDISLETKEERQRREIISSLHKAADSREIKGLSLQDRAVQGREYESSLSDKIRFFKVLGFDKLRHRGESYKLSSVQGMSTTAAEQALDAEKEESYQHKTSTQEKAARRRGEYKDYKLDQKTAANLSLSLYKNAKMDPAEAPAVRELNGREFLQRPDETSGDVADRMCGLLLSRDALKKKIDDMSAKADLPFSDKLYVDQLKVLLERTEDAVNTWYLANGVSLNGEKVTEKMMKAAAEHLPLALEKYKFQNDNLERLHGEAIIELLEKQTSYKNEKKLNDDAAAADDKANDRISGISDIKRDQVDALQKLIADHPEAYKKNKSNINKAFSLFAERLRMIAHESERLIISQNLSLRASISGDARTRLDDALAKKKESMVLSLSVMEYQAESAEAYIRYLITGEKTDPWHAAFIEKTFGEKGCNVDKDAPIPKTVPEYVEAEKRFEERKKELTRLSKSETDPVKKAWYKRALGRYRTKIDDTSFKAWILSETTDNAFAIDLLQEKLTGEDTYQSSENSDFARLVKAMTPIGQPPVITEEELFEYGDQLSIVKTGVDLKKEQADESAQAAAFLNLCGMCDDEVKALEKYMADNPEMLKDRTSLDSIHNWHKLPEFMDKALALTHIIQTLVESPVFDRISQKDQKDVLLVYAKIDAMRTAADVLLDRVSHARFFTATEYLRIHPAPVVIEEASYPRLLTESKRRFKRMYQGDRGRAFKRIGRGNEIVYRSADRQ